jgi:hypothetical protein
MYVGGMAKGLAGRAETRPERSSRIVGQTTQKLTLRPKCVPGLLAPGLILISEKEKYFLRRPAISRHQLVGNQQKYALNPAFSGRNETPALPDLSPIAT